MKSEKLRSALLLTLIASLLVSCGGPSGTQGDESTSGTDTSAPVTEEIKLSEFEKLPEEDYGGYTFNILLNNQDDRFVDVMTEDEQNGDLMNDIVYKRNLDVEQKYNIDIECQQDEYQNVVSTARTTVLAGDQTYDLYFSNCYATPLAAEGYLFELNALPNVDLSNPWWDQAALEDLSVRGKSYLATGDISPTSLMTSSCMTFNKNLLDDIGMEYPYDLVYEGKWTIDKLASLTTDLSRDLNGDSQYTLEDDLFGYTSWMCDSPYSFFYGSGGMLSKKNSEDVPEVSYDIDKITKIYEQVYKIILTNNSYFVTDAAKYETFYKCFADGKAYFSEFTLQKIEMFLRDMKDDFGIIPIPKFDENQKEYISCVNGAGGFVVVPKNAEDPARTGMIMEALGAGAYDGITPTLYEVITKTKVARDEQSSEMVDIIISNRVFDPYYINLIPGYNFMQEALTQKSDSIVSKLDSYRSSAEKALSDIADTYAENVD